MDLSVYAATMLLLTAIALCTVLPPAVRAAPMAREKALRET